MNMIGHLILKDWYLNRWVIAGYLLGGAIALALLGTGGKGAFNAGMILLITVLIALGFHVAMATVVVERTEHTLPFVMSLPISVRDYTAAKIGANLLIFMIPWTIISAGTLAVIAGRQTIPDGLIPYATIILTEIFLGYILVLAVALISESQGWTISTIMVTNLLFQAVLYFVSHLPAIANHMKGAAIVWNSTALALLGIEAAAIVLILVLTFMLQARKTDFI